MARDVKRPLARAGGGARSPHRGPMRSGSLRKPSGAPIQGKEVGLGGLSQRVATVSSSRKGRALGRGCGPVYAPRAAQGRCCVRHHKPLTPGRKLSHCRKLWQSRSRLATTFDNQRLLGAGLLRGRRKGKVVRIHRGPAAVIGDERRNSVILVEARRRRG